MSSSLSSDTKDAIARKPPVAEHCRAALLGALALYGSRKSIFRTQRAAVARLFWTLLGDHRGPVRKEAGTRLARLPSYAIDIPPQLASSVPKPSRRCDRRAEIAGAFLACGSVAAPVHGYHLEFVPPSAPSATRLASVLTAEGFPAKRTMRKGRAVLYYKDADAVVGLLSSIGGFAAVLHLESVRAYKETKNRIVRLVNTDAANVGRAASAAARARHAIGLLAERSGLKHLSPVLREIAELRLAHPEESLGELGQRCKPPASKSTVNGRIATLLRLAAKARR